MVIVNPSYVLGVGDWCQSSTVRINYVWGQGLFDPGGIINLVDIRDLVEVTYQLLESSLKNERYIVSATHMTWRHFFREVAKRLKGFPPSWHQFQIGQEASCGAWKAYGPGSMAPLITRDAIHTASLRYVSNNDKIRSALHMNLRPIAERRLIGYVMLVWKTRSMAVQSNLEVVFSHPETLRPRDLFTLKRVSQPNQPRCRSVRWIVAVYSTWSCRQDVMSGQLGQYPLHFLIGA